MHTSILPVLCQGRMTGKIKGSRMFKNKHSFRIQQFMAKNHVGKITKPVQIVGRIREHNVVFYPAGFNVISDVCTDRGYLVKTKSFRSFQDERIIPVIVLNKVNRFAIPGSEFVTDAAGSGKEVKYTDGCDIIVIGNDIEKTLFRQIGRWPGIEISWRMNDLTPVFPTYYSQV